MQDLFLRANNLEQVISDFPFIANNGELITDSPDFSVYIVGNEIATPATEDTEATYTGKILVNIRVRDGNYETGTMPNGTEILSPQTPNAVWA